MSEDVFEYEFSLDHKKIMEEIFQSLGLTKEIEEIVWDGKSLRLRIKADLTSSQIYTLSAVVMNSLPFLKGKSKKLLPSKKKEQYLVDGKIVER